MLVSLTALAVYIVTSRLENTREVERQRLVNIAEQYAERRARVMADKLYRDRSAADASTAAVSTSSHS